jgi:alpha-N-arabinofuranosidase
MPTFARWEAAVLEQCYHLVDHLSVHMYVDPDATESRADLLAAGLDVDEYLDAIIATTDHVRATGRHSKRMTLAFDEWNVWYNRRRREPGDWQVAPRLIEDTYTLTDGIVAGSFLMSLLRHADRVKIACLAQLVNVIAPIRTEPGGGPVWRQSLFYPFALTARHGRGTVLHTGVRCGRHDTVRRTDVPDLDAVSVWHADTGELTVFAVNRNQASAVPVELAIGGVPGLGAGAQIRHTVLTGPDPDATNSAAHPRAVAPVELPDDTRVAHDGPSVALPPLSWNMLRITPR